MMSETDLMNCQDVPQVMQDAFDKPWEFVGETKEGVARLHSRCSPCSAPDLVGFFSPTMDYAFKPMQIVDLEGYKFITDDMIVCMIYFGTCSKCGRVIWARQGPPFKRARCLSPVN